MGQAFWRIVRQFLKELSMELPWDSGIPFLGIYSREMKTHVHTKLVHKYL